MSYDFTSGNTSKTNATNLRVSEKVNLLIVLILIALISNSDSTSYLDFYRKNKWSNKNVIFN